MAVLLIVAVIVAGVLVGIALGGDVRTLSELKLRWWPLALIGLGLQLAPVPSLGGQLDHWLAVGLLVASYVLLLAFVAMNIKQAGFPVIAVGFALNLLVISVNGGMPVSDRALRQAFGPAYPEAKQDLLLRGGAKHHLQRPDDVLVPLADVIPIGPPVRQVFSVGDLLFMAGVVWVLAAATRGVGSGRARVRRVRLGDPAGLGRNFPAPPMDP